MKSSKPNDQTSSMPSIEASAGIAVAISSARELAQALCDNLNRHVLETDGQGWQQISKVVTPKRPSSAKD